MKANHHFLVFALLIIIGNNFTISRQVLPRKVEETVVLSQDYTLSWEIDEKNELVTFKAVVQTSGYVGLGISPNGGMDRADIFIAGVDNGKPYYFDMHGNGPASSPVNDIHEDWNLLEANETNGVTRLKFSRLLDTCDDEDFPITADDTVRLIWSIGSTDKIAYHYHNRGSKSVNLLPLSLTDGDVSKFDTWSMNINGTMPHYETSYWCTIHKRPRFGKIQHIVGFDAYFQPNSEAEKHTHHFIVYKCYPPKTSTAEEIFEKHIGDPGEECYGSTKRLPTEYCPEYLFVWAIGGKATLFPDDIGYPIERTHDESLYYMLEVHYDNPSKSKDVTFETGVKIYHTDVLRNKEAGIMAIGLDTSPSMTIPPNSDNFIVAGHCPADCTNAFPEEGISLFNILLHSHLSGRELKIRHFRGKEELPWILSDTNYDFNYQQNKPLKDHVKVLRGDHLTYECNYNTKWNNGSIVFGGLSTEREMCQTFVWYYPQMKIDVCGGNYNEKQNYLDFGITNYTSIRDATGEEMPIILEPESMKDMNYTMAISTVFNWTTEFREQFQNKRLNGDLEYFCVTRALGPIKKGVTKYPEYRKAYAPRDKCNNSSATRSSMVALLMVMVTITSFLCTVP